MLRRQSAAQAAVCPGLVWVVWHIPVIDHLSRQFHRALAVFGPAGVNAGQEVSWCAVYAGMLWVVVATDPGAATQ